MIAKQRVRSGITPLSNHRAGSDNRSLKLLYRALIAVSFTSVRSSLLEGIRVSDVKIPFGPRELVIQSHHLGIRSLVTRTVDRSTQREWLELSRHPFGFSKRSPTRLCRGLPLQNPLLYEP